MGILNYTEFLKKVFFLILIIAINPAGLLKKKKKIKL